MRLATFEPQHGVHCETTTLRNMLHHAGVNISEAMLFGLGQGIDIQYWDAPLPGRSTPMLTGRTGPGDVSRNACSALGVELHESRSTDPESARSEATKLLDAGNVVGITVDIYYLDYFASRTHFASHYLALYGLDDSVAYVVDTEQQGGAQSLPDASLRLARDSAEGFMPSPNSQMHLADLPVRLTSDVDSVLREQIWNSIRMTATRMVADRGPRLGITALRRAAAEIGEWSDTLTPAGELVPEVGRFWRFAGTGGANFRKLYLAFLREARQRSGDAGLDRFIAGFDDVRRQWDQAIEMLLTYPDAADPKERLSAVETRLTAIAHAEQSAFEQLLELSAHRAGEPM